MPVALNVDGLERKRKKWNAAGAQAGISSRNGSSTFCPTAIVSDAEKIADYYRETLRQEHHVHSLRRRVGKVSTTADALQQLGLEPGQYFLYVSRMEPENNALLVRRGVRASLDTDEAGADRRRAVRAKTTSRGCATPAIRAS